MFPRRDRVSVLCYSPTKIYANNITQHAGETLCRVVRFSQCLQA